MNHADVTFCFSGMQVRTVHVPFFQPDSKVTEAEKTAAKEAMQQCIHQSGGTDSYWAEIYNRSSPGLHSSCSKRNAKMGYRAHKSYATVLAFALLYYSKFVLCCNTNYMLHRMAVHA